MIHDVCLSLPSLAVYVAPSPLSDETASGVIKSLGL